jgi:protein subunit release factor B
MAAEARGEGERPEIVVRPGAGGEDSQDFARMLREMYAAWGGDLSQESGVHRLVRKSPHDPRRYRHTSFAQVFVDGKTKPDQIRSYILDPYKLCKNHQTGRETEEVHRVLAGELNLILPPPASTQPSPEPSK